MNQWIKNASISVVKQLENSGKTISAWLSGIVNSISTDITNEFTEEYNTKIKVLSAAVIISFNSSQELSAFCTDYCVL